MRLKLFIERACQRYFVCKFHKSIIHYQHNQLPLLFFNFFRKYDSPSGSLQVIVFSSNLVVAGERVIFKLQK